MKSDERDIVVFLVVAVSVFVDVYYVTHNFGDVHYSHQNNRAVDFADQNTADDFADQNTLVDFADQNNADDFADQYNVADFADRNIRAVYFADQNIHAVYPADQNIADDFLHIQLPSSSFLVSHHDEATIETWRTYSHSSEPSSVHHRSSTIHLQRSEVLPAVSASVSGRRVRCHSVSSPEVEVVLSPV